MLQQQRKNLVRIKLKHPGWHPVPNRTDNHTPAAAELAVARQVLQPMLAGRCGCLTPSYLSISVDSSFSSFSHSCWTCIQVSSLWWWLATSSDRWCL